MVNPGALVNKEFTNNETISCCLKWTCPTVYHIRSWRYKDMKILFQSLKVTSNRHLEASLDLNKKNYALALASKKILTWLCNPNLILTSQAAQVLFLPNRPPNFRGLSHPFQLICWHLIPHWFFSASNAAHLQWGETNGDSQFQEIPVMFSAKHIEHIWHPLKTNGFLHQMVMVIWHFANWKITMFSRKIIEQIGLFQKLCQLCGSSMPRFCSIPLSFLPPPCAEVNVSNLTLRLTSWLWKMVHLQMIDLEFTWLPL